MERIQTWKPVREECRISSPRRVSKRQINKFCGPCDEFKPGCTSCHVGFDFQTDVVAAGRCLSAKVDGIPGMMLTLRDGEPIFLTSF